MQFINNLINEVFLCLQIKLIIIYFTINNNP